MNEIKISVIIPTYNQSKLFERALKSVVDQSFKNLEVIVVDDNSDKEISQLIKKIIKDQSIGNIRYFKNEFNSGSVYSRNKGIEESTGDYVTFLDDDDYYDRKKIELQLKEMKLNGSLFSVCNIILQHSNGKEEVRRRDFLKNKENLFSMHIKYHIAATSTFMFDRQFINSIGRFTESDFGDDYYLMEQAIFASNRFSHVDYNGVYATINHEHGLSSWKNKIEMENRLYNYKLKFKPNIKPKDFNYIKMRHHAVKAVAYRNGKKWINMFVEITQSFLVSPLSFVRLLQGRDK